MRIHPHVRVDLGSQSEIVLEGLIFDLLDRVVDGEFFSPNDVGVGSQAPRQRGLSHPRHRQRAADHGGQLEQERLLRTRVGKLDGFFDAHLTGELYGLVELPPAIVLEDEIHLQCLACADELLQLELE